MSWDIRLLPGPLTSCPHSLIASGAHTPHSRALTLPIDRCPCHRAAHSNLDQFATENALEDGVNNASLSATGLVNLLTPHQCCARRTPRKDQITDPHVSSKTTRQYSPASIAADVSPDMQKHNAMIREHFNLSTLIIFPTRPLGRFQVGLLSCLSRTLYDDARSQRR